MEGTQFYLHLPSNSSLDKFPKNTLSEYRVGLSQTIILSGDWEVALTDIHYPHSWNNVQGDFRNRFYLRNPKLHGLWEVLMIPSGHYSSITGVIAKMNEVVGQDERFKDDVRFSFDTLNRKVTVYLQNGAEIYFSDIGHMLRFSSNTPISSTSIAEREADLEQRFHDLYVYSDIVQAQLVGDALVPLLRIVPVQGNDGQRVSRSFERPHYLPVSRREFETIEVNIKRDTGESVPFELGKVLLTLHFRQSRTANF